MKKVQVNPLMPFTQVWWETGKDGEEMLIKKDSWVDVADSVWQKMKGRTEQIGDLAMQVFIAEDEEVVNKRVIERIDISDKEISDEVVEEDSSTPEWYSSAEEE